MGFEFLPLLISTLGYCAFSNLVLNVRATVTPLLWACFVTTFIYAFAVVGFLELGARLALWLGIALALATIWLQRKNPPRPAFKWFVSPVFLLPLCLSFFAIQADFVFLNWDEVGGWAKTQKLIFDTDALLNANSPMSLRSYPPGQQIFQYFFTKATWWSEKHLLVAQNIFLFSGLVALVGALITRPVWAALVYLTLLPLIYFFHFDYTTIYADPLLVCVFAGCLGLAFKPREGFKDDLVLALCLCGFVLLKDIAAAFAVLVLAIYALNAFAAPSTAEPTTLTKNLARASGAVLVSGLALFAVLRSWQWYVNIIGSSKNEVLKVTLQSLIEPAFQNRLGLTISNFVYQLLKPDYVTGSLGSLGRLHLSFSMVAVMGLALVTSILIITLTARKQRLCMSLSLIGLSVGAIGYLLLLLWLYLTYFTEYEGTRLASFDRYSMTYLLAWVLVLYTLLCATLAKLKAQYLVVIPFVGLILSYALVPAKFYTDARQIPLDQVSFEKKKKAQALADEVRRHIKPGEKVYFVAQNTNGYERHLFDYAMLPYPPVDCWSIGKKYNEGDVWSCDRPLGFFLHGYAYLALYHADARFWTENAELFTPEGRNRESGVYKINRQTDGKVLLSPTQ